MIGSVEACTDVLGIADKDRMKIRMKRKYLRKKEPPFSMIV